MARRRSSAGKSRHNNSTSGAGTAASGGALEFSNHAVLTLVGEATENGGVVAWAELREAFPDLKRLRDMVRGLIRNGDLEADSAGNYYLPGAGGSRELQRGLVVAAPRGSGTRLLVRLLEGSTSTDSASGTTLPLLPPSRDKRTTVWVREGDEIGFVTALAQGSSATSNETSNQTAQVIEVFKHSSAPIIGVLQNSRFGPFIDSLSPDFRGKVQLDELPSELGEGDTVSVRVVGSDRFGLRGDVIGVISRGDVADAAAVTLIASHGIPEEWPADALAQADALPAVVQPGSFGDRVDLQDLPLVTIDGADARDFDDAVFVEAQAAGGWRLIVAIADVAHYVKSGSALDVAAYERGNSVYLPDRVIPMLPESLSNGLCSLRPDEPRLSLVCDMQIAANGHITDYKFYDAVICSWARLTYSEVSEHYTLGANLPIAEAGHPSRTSEETLEGVLANVDELRKVFGALLKARAERGALEFETRSGVLRIEEGRVAEIIEVTRNDAHRLIEEAMISANVCAAKFIASKEARGLYRVHEPPQKEKVEVLRDALAYAGIRVRDVPSDPKQLADLLAPLAGREDSWLLYSLILRSMSQACYQPENRGHFGLALADYMHFTSPIRRYPDLIVHRTIKALVNGKQPPLQSMDQLVQAGEHLSATERRAEDCERGVSNWLKCAYVAHRVGETFTGTVVGVQDFGLFVELEGYFVQGLVHISALGEDFFNFVPQSMSLVGDRSGASFKLGDTFDVVLLDVQPAQGKLDLEPLANHQARKRGRNQSSRDKGRPSGPSGKGEKGGKGVKGVKGGKGGKGRKGGRR